MQLLYWQTQIKLVILQNGHWLKTGTNVYQELNIELSIRDYSISVFPDSVPSLWV